MGVARGVVRREVQRGEVMKVVFHIRAFSHGKAHIGENHRQLFHHLGDRVQRALRLALHRPGDVHAFARQRRVHRGVFEIGLAGFQQRVEAILQAIERRAHHLALFRAHLAQLAHFQGHLALLAQRAHAQGVKRSKVGRRFNISGQARFQRIKIGRGGHGVTPGIGRAVIQIGV